MYHFFAEPSACGGDNIILTGEDFHHIRDSLRLRYGEQVAVSDGGNREYICEITEYTASEVILRIIDIRGGNAELPTEITLYQGFPKGDKLEFIIQKAVELGAVRIVPVYTGRSLVRLENGKAEKRIKRYNAIALNAARQSGRNRIPTVESAMSFQEALEDAKALELNLIPYEEAEGIAGSREALRKAAGKKSLGVFIGPEGGFEAAEVAAARAIGAECITLGRRILRTETAGMALLSILMFELEQEQGDSHGSIF